MGGGEHWPRAAAVEKEEVPPTMIGGGRNTPSLLAASKEEQPVFADKAAPVPN